MNNDGSVYTEDAVVTQFFLSTMRKSDSYTVAISEFWGQRGLRRRRGEGEGKIRTPQQRLGDSLWRSMEIGLLK